jgi:sugar O-acyltransferase (sialic acid O-acetyltransferase NeuD family)
MDRAPLIVIGGSGHAKVLISTLRLLARPVLGFTELDETLPELLGVRNLGGDPDPGCYSPREVRLVNGVGSTGSPARRQAVYQRLRSMGYSFETVIHPSAVIAPDVQIGEGVQIMAGVIVQTGARLGEDVILNTGSRIDHDCRIGAHAHVAPGAILAGNVQICSGVHVGAGSTIIQGRTIGAGAIVGAGAVVIRDVAEGTTVLGVPAVPVRQAARAGR